MRNDRWIPAAVMAATLGLGVTACEPMDPAEPGALVPRTVIEDPTLPSVEVNGTRLHLQTFGDPAKPVIVFLHGGPGGDYRSELRLAERFGGRSLVDDHFLVFWDQRGSGLSERVGRRTLTIDQYVADLDAIVARYSPGRPAFLIGESWGGMFAAAYIDRYPQKVAGAVLIEPGPMDGATMERLEDDITSFQLGSELLNDVAWSGQFLSGDDHARMDYERLLGMRDDQPKYHESRSNPSPSWRMGAAASRYIMEDGQDASGRFDYDFTTNLQAYTTPVLFIAGALSEVLGPSLQQEQMRHFPNATLAVVPGVGHDAAWIRTAEVLAHVNDYLAARRGGIQ